MPEVSHHWALYASTAIAQHLLKRWKRGGGRGRGGGFKGAAGDARVVMLAKAVSRTWRTTARCIHPSLQNLCLCLHRFTQCEVQDLQDVLVKYVRTCIVRMASYHHRCPGLRQAPALCLSRKKDVTFAQ